MSYTLQMVQDDLTPILGRLRQAIKQDLASRILQVAQDMMNLAESIVLVRTGYLRSTIYAKIVDFMTVEFGASADYARFVEEGTYRMAARPFIWPAYVAYVQRLVEEIVDSIMEVLR